jgi:hypothetical protein
MSKLQWKTGGLRCELPRKPRQTAWDLQIHAHDNRSDGPNASPFCPIWNITAMEGAMLLPPNLGLEQGSRKT